MKILLVGSGAREHALAWKISKSTLLDKLYLYPGNAASQALGTPVSLPAKASFDELAEFADSEGISAIICGPEQPLAAGLADVLQNKGIPVFGPIQAGAELESSKVFAKEIMAEAKIKTAGFSIAGNIDECREQAMEKLERTNGVVLKASGLAGGKGVFVCFTADEVEAGLDRLYNTGMSTACDSVVVETVLRGRECSFFSLVGDGPVVDLGFAVDFKRLKDGDKGPNTGGMGCYTPVPWLPNDAAKIVNEEIVKPLLSTLEKRGIHYRGFLYTGIMWGESGPEVVEFNVRLGDPEAQVLAFGDNRDWLAIICQQLGIEISADIEIAPGTSDKGSVLGVVLASAGYPYGEGEKAPANLPKSIFSADDPDSMAFAAAVEPVDLSDSQKGCDGFVRSKSGRVMSVVASGSSFSDARKAVYEKVKKIESVWPSCQYRSDIGQTVISEES